MKPWIVDVPVRVQVWNRPDCLKKQMDVLKQARPSVLFLISDGGRNEAEMALINESRSIMEGIDWECQVHKLYMESNQGMYAMGKLVSNFIWDKVDRCIFLEDDYVPAVSYFRYCAELLEKYKDDERIEMICGYNPLGIYEPAASEQDYFFSENGWAIWGIARWKRSVTGHEFPLPYKDSPYICCCLTDNMTPFWKKKAKGYIRGELVDNHVPADEYHHAANSVLYHRVSIIPSKNMISNIGIDGAHASAALMTSKAKRLFNSKVYEIEFPMRHPTYVVDDKRYSKLYEKALDHERISFSKVVSAILLRWNHLKKGTYYKKFIRKSEHEEK